MNGARNPVTAATRLIPGQEGGFSALVALVVIVLFALISAAMLTLSTSEHLAGLLSLRASQAYFSASAGLEWGISQVPACAASETFGAAVEGFTVTVTCDQTADIDDGTVYRLYTLTATAIPVGLSPGDPLYARRQVRVVIRNP